MYSSNEEKKIQFNAISEMVGVDLMNKIEADNRDGVQKKELDDHSSQNTNSKIIFELKRKAVDWFNGSTFHGLSNLINSEYIFLRLFWLLLISLSVSYCLYSISVNLDKYYEYEVGVDYFTATESPTDFPAVTICNSNPFNIMHQTKILSYINGILHKNNITTPLTLDSDDEAFYTVRRAATIIKASVTADKNMSDTEKMNFGFLFNDMVFSCYYNGIPCNESDFIYSRTHIYGNCFTFNRGPKPIKKTSKTGPDSGLTMELFVGKAGQQDNYTMKSGLYVAIHNQTNLPLVKDEGFIVQTGASANIAIERTFYSRLSSPFSNCRKDVDSVLPTDSQFYKYTSQITKYSQKLCYEICFQYKYAIPRCNCSDPSVPVVDTDQQICNTFASLECIEDARNEFDNSPIGQFCDPYCPLECDSIDYDVSIASAHYPRNNPNATFYSDEFEDDLLQITVFYETLRYSSVVEIEGYSLETLIGVIGGFLALFLGASVISFIEILELIIEFTITIFQVYLGHHDLRHLDETDSDGKLTSQAAKQPLHAQTQSIPCCSYEIYKIEEENESNNSNQLPTSNL